MSDLRCPRCGAARRAGDQWCGLCYADFREPPPAVVGDSQQPAAAPAAPVQGPSGELAPPLIRPPVPGSTQPPAAPAPAASPSPAPAVPAIPTQTATPVVPRPAGSPFVPSTNPLAPTAAMPTQLSAGVEPAVVDPAAASEGEQEAEADPVWPCPRCGEPVPMSEDYCKECGHGFLDDVRGTGGTKLPLVGDVSKMNSGQKLALGVTISLFIIVGILVVLALGGAIFH